MNSEARILLIFDWIEVGSTFRYAQAAVLDAASMWVAGSSAISAQRPTPAPLMTMKTGRRPNRYILLGASAIFTSGLAGPLAAQVTPNTTLPPYTTATDRNNINLASGAYQISTIDVDVGPNGSALQHVRTSVTNSQFHQFAIGITGDESSALNVVIGNKTYSFYKSGTQWVSTRQDGSTLDKPSGYRFINKDGTQYLFIGVFQQSSPVIQSSYWPIGYPIALGSSILYPDGHKQTFSYRSYSAQSGVGTNRKQYYYYRLRNVVDSRGLMLLYEYEADAAGAGGFPTYQDLSISGVTAINLGVDYCSSTADHCSGLSTSARKISYLFSSNYSQFQIVDPLGRSTTVTSSLSSIAIRHPSSSVDNIAISYPSGVGTNTNVTIDGANWFYGFTKTATRMQAVITNPDNSTRTIVSDLSVGLPVSIVDELGRSTSLSYDPSGRLTSVTHPAQNIDQYTYDARGNVVQKRQISNTPGTPADIVTSATYDLTCSNQVTCNKPGAVFDAKGNETDYTYDPTHGGILTVTAPAPVAGGIKPQSRYSYVTKEAYYKDAGGSVVASGAPIYLLTTVSACQTLASCTGTSDEFKATIDYGSQSTGTANNLWPLIVNKGAGDGSLTAATTLNYDSIGNVIKVDGPLPGTADSTLLAYDADREQNLVVGADPDGAGSLHNRAVRTNYNVDSTINSVERGTSSPDGSGFTSLQQATAGYDSYGRKASDILSAGGTTYNYTQYSYDASGRLDCTAVRMNSGAFASVPSSACALGTSSTDGPDRIVKNIYDAASELTKVQTAYGTSNQVDSMTKTYTSNGDIATIADANNNLTTYTYDGFGRPTQTRYPSLTTSGTSNVGDYEQLGYDPNGNVTSRRLRDNQTIGYTYDALNRLVAKDRPNDVYWETDQSFAYDSLGHLTGASDSYGHSLSFGYDALGRKTGQGDNWYTFGNASFAYDLAGRRTRLTWADGAWVGYDYDAAHEISAIRDSAGNALVTFGYDDLGRRTSLSRANGTVTSYGYDAVSRLSSLTQNLNNAATNLTVGMTYNPAGQIASRTSSNDSYAWTGAVNVDRAYVANGLNQYTSSGGVAMGYDGRGNLNNSGGNGYTYTSDNQLANGLGVNLAYDPLGRLFNGNFDPGYNTTLNYDGADVIAETDQNTGALLRRYVPGPGTDEPVIWYEGSGFGDKRWLHTDERGSVIAVTNDAAGVLGINRYDEYGIPQAGNIGRFQYTGQKWLPSIGLYDYKARMYSPTLGRFMQTDPIGYSDGLNWYNYVDNDPINFTDPSGLQSNDVVVTATRLGGFAGGTNAGPSKTTPSNDPDIVEARNKARKPQSTFRPDPGYVEPSDLDLVVIGALSGVSEAVAAEDIVVTASRGWFSRLIDGLVGRSACFAAGTLVETDHGLRAIETIKPSDMVLSRDEKTGRTAYKRVTAVKTPAEDELYTVELDVPAEKTTEHRADFKATATHPWRTIEGRWVETAQLRRGMKLVRADGAPAKVEEVQDAGRKALTYNLTVEGYHTYFVGKDRVWVHNACDIVFKTAHYAPRLERAGVEVQAAENAVKEALAAGGPGDGSVSVNGRQLLYRTFTRPDGTVSVGTIHIPW